MSAITDEAVEAAAAAIGALRRQGPEHYCRDARAGLEAALPYLPPQPVAPRERVAEALERYFSNGGPDTPIRTTWHDGEEYWEAPASDIRQLLAAHPVEPAPFASPERVAVALHDSDCPDRRCEPTAMGKYYTQTDALLAAGVFRQAPTREQIKAAIASAANQSKKYEDCVYVEGYDDEMAAAVLALIGGEAK